MSFQTELNAGTLGIKPCNGDHRINYEMAAYILEQFGRRPASRGDGGAWILSLPPAPAAAAAPPIAQEADATLAALKPPKRQRPLIAIIGINDATEVTDYLMPYGILRRADVADVIALATALKVEPRATVAEFDARNPEGADDVIVHAMSRDDDPAALQWLKSQADKRAIIIGVCAGAKIVGAAGLLDGKRATTHWYNLKELCDEHPATSQLTNPRSY